MLHPQSTALFLQKIQANLPVYGSIPKALHKTYGDYAPKQEAWIAIFHVVRRYKFPHHEREPIYPKFGEYTPEQNHAILSHAIEYCNEIAADAMAPRKT